MGAPIIFNGAFAKTLTESVKLAENIRLITGDTDDPTSVAKDAPEGSLYFRDGTDEIYKKTDNGSSTNWEALVSGSVNPFSVSSISGTVSLASGTTYLVDTSGGVATLTLPAPSANAYVYVKDSTGDANTNNITINRNSTEDIDGAASVVIDSDYGSVLIVSDSTDWFIL